MVFDQPVLLLFVTSLVMDSDDVTNTCHTTLLVEIRKFRATTIYGYLKEPRTSISVNVLFVVVFLRS